MQVRRPTASQEFRTCEPVDEKRPGPTAERATHSRQLQGEGCIGFGENPGIWFELAMQASCCRKQRGRCWRRIGGQPTSGAPIAILLRSLCSWIISALAGVVTEFERSRLRMMLGTPEPPERRVFVRRTQSCGLGSGRHVGGASCLPPAVLDEICCDPQSGDSPVLPVSQSHHTATSAPGGPHCAAPPANRHDARQAQTVRVLHRPASHGVGTSHWQLCPDLVAPVIAGM